MLHTEAPSGVVDPLRVLMARIAVGLLSAITGRTQDLRICCVLFLASDSEMEGNWPVRSDRKNCYWNTGISQLHPTFSPEDRNTVELGYDVIEGTEKLRHYKQVSLYQRCVVKVKEKYFTTKYSMQTQHLILTL